MNSFHSLRIQRDSSLTISDQLVQQLTWLISVGKISAGEQLPPIRAAALSLGVHMHTVRAAYHRLEAQGLLSTSPGAGTKVLEYKPYLQNEEISSSALWKVGVILPELDSFHSQVLSGVHQALQEEGISLSLAISGYDPSAAELNLDRLMCQSMNGVINISSGFSAEFQSSWLQHEPKISMPLVFANAPDMQGLGVHLELAQAAFQAAVHLVDHGHSALGLITLPQAWPLGEIIYQGFVEGLRARSAGTGQLFIKTVSRLNVEFGYDAGIQFCRSALRPTAIFALSDRLAVGAIQAFREQGLRVPEDIAILACHDSELAKYSQPGITAFSSSAAVMGYQAGRLMVQSLKLEGMKNLEPQLLPMSLIPRASCGCAAE
jgi:DNA-binding LacI/PurR family transcriptional regulator